MGTRWIRTVREIWWFAPRFVAAAVAVWFERRRGRHRRL